MLDLIGRRHDTRMRPGSIIIYIHLSFEKPTGQEELTSMLQEAARKGHFHKNVDPDSITDVSDIPVKTLSIVVFAVVVLVFAVVIIIIIYMVHKRRKCRRKEQRIHTETDERQAFSSNHSTLSGTNPYAELKSGYAMSGPQPQGEVVIEQGEGEVGGEPPAEIVIGHEHSKKKHRKKDKKVTEQKPTEDQYAVADKSKKKKKKNAPDATYAEVDLSKKAKKKPNPGEVLYADLGEFHKTQKTPDVSTSLKTLSPTKRPEAYTETTYADITQFLKGNPQETSAEPTEDGTTLPRNTVMRFKENPLLDS
ncbi:hypothetical protein AWC38_SpisGene11700 [Stylophora pistillata]|uniref:Uncharacterized protein n=1 Tax=Stylophora pistillata TaxID=50429 RepID=A0A2B4S5E3_STYPI|nr:hypothetical protein AWC38_SpisGene11700 [Stylophora pistillata]